MQIYLTKDGAQTGPFSEDQVRSMLAGGVVSPSDYCWHGGLSGWVPVSQVVQPAAPPMVRPLQVPAPAGFPAAGQWSASPANDRPYAGFWLRVLAYIIDAVVMFVAYLPVGIVLGFSMAAAGIDQEVMRLASGFVNLLAWWLYQALMESSAKQATLGKMALGLIVTDLQGQRVSFGKATGRYWGMFLSGLALCIGLIMCAFTERKQCLHDMIAGCLVVKK